MVQVQYIHVLTEKGPPKSDLRKRVPPGGMTYIYDSVSAADGIVKSNTNVPIVGQVAPVLMTTQNHWYAGPGA